MEDCLCFAHDGHASTTGNSAVWSVPFHRHRPPLNISTNKLSKRSFDEEDFACSGTLDSLMTTMMIGTGKGVVLPYPKRQLFFPAPLHFWHEPTEDARKDSKVSGAKIESTKGAT
jgi:hypothetical protein